MRLVWFRSVAITLCATSLCLAAIGISPSYASGRALESNSPVNKDFHNGHISIIPRREKSAPAAQSPSNRVQARRLEVGTDLASKPQPTASRLLADSPVGALVTGTAPVSPWFPGRGAIGVSVKVTW